MSFLEYGSDYATGYVTGMASPGFVVYNDSGGAAEFSSAKPFNFVGAYLTAAWLDDLEITVEGFLDSTLVEASDRQGFSNRQAVVHLRL